MEMYLPTMRPYLTYSTLLHAGLLIALFALSRRPDIVANQAYRIDFIGPSAGILNREPEAGPAKTGAPPSSPATRPPPLEARDEFGLAGKKHKHRALPRPSVLGERSETPKPAAAQASAAPAPAAQTSPGAGASSQAGEGAGVSTDLDLPNFPYPWYVTELRSALWDQWSHNMPAATGEAMVTFSIMRGGNVVDLRVESSSGESSVDGAAVAAVQGAAPFTPLPREFSDSFLKVHVRFRTQ